MQIRIAHVHERVLLLRFVGLLTAITSDSPMKPGRTRNTRLAESRPPFIMSRSTKVISTLEEEKLLENYLGTQGTYKTPRPQIGPRDPGGKIISKKESLVHMAS